MVAYVVTDIADVIKLRFLSERNYPGFWVNQCGSDSKEFSCSVGGPGLIPALGRSLEKGMETHSSILAWRIPWTEEPGGLQSMESQRVGHN